MFRRIIPAILAVILLSSCSKYLERSIESPQLEGRKVTFRIRFESARTVQVAGDWNNWGRGDAEQGEVLVGRMDYNKDESYWEKTVRLEAGRYTYRFLINESIWMLDGNNPRVVDDMIGGKASLLIVP